MSEVFRNYWIVPDAPVKAGGTFEVDEAICALRMIAKKVTHQLAGVSDEATRNKLIEDRREMRQQCRLLGKKARVMHATNASLRDIMPAEGELLFAKGI
ncbi:MAG: hypothetical protein Q7S44_03825 [bacterium]|nr:hypothetical protein [bacterium]